LAFDIHLHQDGDHLTGYHSGGTKDGRRTDTAPDGEGEPSIKGRIKGDTATVDVHSAYSDAVVTGAFGASWPKLGVEDGEGEKARRILFPRQSNSWQMSIGYTAAQPAGSVGP